MKIIILAITLSLLAGCSISKFNPVEYDHYARMSATADIAKEYCNQPKQVQQYISTLRISVRTAAIYAKYLPANTKAYDATQIMLSIVEEMNKRYTSDKVPSTAYCKLKFKNIESASIRIMEAVGEKPNVN